MMLLTILKLCFSSILLSVVFSAIHQHGSAEAFVVPLLGYHQLNSSPRPSSIDSLQARAADSMQWPKKWPWRKLPNSCRIEDCLGSGSYGTVHYVTVWDNEQSNTMVGKRAWTQEEIACLNPSLSANEIQQQASMCEYYWKAEVHCFEKLKKATDKLRPAYATVPEFVGTLYDNENRRWMLFEAAMLCEGVVAPSLRDLMEQDRNDHIENRQHHLYKLSHALGLNQIQNDGDLFTSELAETMDIVIGQVLELIAFVHSQKLVHRDVKPGNLLVATSRLGTPRLLLIDFGSAADLETAGLLKSNIGLSAVVAVSPIYSAPEVFVDPSLPQAAQTFDCFSAALTFCQLLFLLLDDRAESGFHQQLAAASWNLDTWLSTVLQSKVRPVGLVDAIGVFAQRPGLWKLLQDMLKPNPRERVSSVAALSRWRTIYQSAIGDTIRNDLITMDGPYLREVLESMELCTIPPTAWPLHYVATFERNTPLGLVISEVGVSETDDPNWKLATKDALPGEVFVKEILPWGQAHEMGIFQVGDRLQGIGELPLAQGGFDRALEMLREQAPGSEYITLHFDRKSTFIDLNYEPGAAQQLPKRQPTLRDHGVWSSRGRRKAQEDSCILHEIQRVQGSPIILAGVMDGHFGRQASKFVQKQFPRVFSGRLRAATTEASTEDLVRATWDEVCRSYQNICVIDQEECIAEYDAREGVLMANIGSKDSFAGTTACIVALDSESEKLTFLNCGDSRALVVDKHGRVRYHTVDHTPKCESEQERFQRGITGGLDYSLPQCRLSRWTVSVGDYEYAVSRSLEGPFSTSRGIIFAPDVSVLPAESDAIVVLATDGLWEVVDTEQVGRIVTGLRNEGVSAGDASKQVCALALRLGSNDNVSTVILYLN